MSSLQSLVQRARDFLARPDVERWTVPYRKPLAASIAAAIVAVADSLGAVPLLPPGYAEAVAAAVVGYLIPERDPRPPRIEVVTRDASAPWPGDEKHFGTPPDFTPDVPAREERVLGDEDTRGLI